MNWLIVATHWTKMKKKVPLTKQETTDNISPALLGNIYIFIL